MGGRAPGSGGLGVQCQTAQSREISALWKPQGQARQAHAEIPKCEMSTTGSLERQSFLSEEGQSGGWCQQVSGEPCTGSGVPGSDNLVNVKPLCDPNESLSHDFELGNSTCVADVCFCELNRWDCDDTHVCTDDAIPASCTPGSALGVRNTWQTFFCLPKDIRSGTQPVCEPLPHSVPYTD